MRSFSAKPLRHPTRFWVKSIHPFYVFSTCAQAELALCSYVGILLMSLRPLKKRSCMRPGSTVVVLRGLKTRQP